MNKRKGLSISGYLTDYGWAIIAVLIVIGLFWYMGFFGNGQCMINIPTCGFEYTEEDGTVVFCRAVEKPLFKEGHTLKSCDNGKIYVNVIEYRRTCD